MVLYRRSQIAGACYFFTLALADRKRSLLIQHVELLRMSFQAVMAKHDFRIDAVVILPDHLHLLMTLPDGDRDYAARIRAIKADFVRRLRAAGEPVQLNARREAGIWQPRFWEHLVRDERDFAAHVDYIHINPVKHGLVQSVNDWPYSSFHRYVRHGVLPANWAGGFESDALSARE